MVSGPYCGKLLADMGADVIKVEPPGGDPAREYGPFPKEGPNPEKSALFLYINTSKRAITLDLGNQQGLEKFKRLLEWADILLDNHPPQTLEQYGLGWDALHTLNPDLIYINITPYGRTGPRADVKGDELTIIHAGGLGNLLPARSVNIDLPPVKLGGSQVGYIGGLVAALAAISFFVGRNTIGEGQLIDISLQEVILALVSPNVTGTRYHETTWCRVPDRPPAMGRMQTKDGYVVLNAFDNHHFKAYREMMGNPEWAEGDGWLDLEYRAHHLKDIAPMLDGWMLKQGKNETHHKAAQARIPIGPIDTAEDVMANEQYASRDFFVEVDHPVAGKYTYAGWPYKISATPPRVTRPAPLLGEHNDEIEREILECKENESASSRAAASPSPEEKGEQRGHLPLEGIRVVEVCWMWAGPYITMLMANLGAEVIRLESHNRTDLTRRTFPWPLPDPAPTPVPASQGMAYNSLNRDKKSVTVDLAKPEGVELAKQLASMSDIFVDNMSAGVMKKLGLGYEDLCRVRPDIIVASSSGRGQEGPQKDYRGYAMVHQAIGGGAYITGHPEDHPSHSGGDMDLMNAITTAYAIIAALYHRQETGEGQFIDYSQCEGVTSLLGEVMLGYEMTSEIPEREGNAHPFFAPHSVYKCWGIDRWLALEVHSDEEFEILARIIGQAELSKDPRFATMKDRKKNETELNDTIEEWTRERDRDWMVEEFCRAGLAAAPSRDARDLYADPHLHERGAYVKIDHPELGELEMVGPPWQIPGRELPTSHAPLLGEHNQYVLKDLLGLNDQEIDELRKKDVIL
jgi:crotonobetainyl-CoA:carnitine CoA-transferase CaiB-like acyl-CoA transferase